MNENPFAKKSGTEGAAEPGKVDAAVADLSGQVEATLDAAEKAGSLKPLQELIDDQGLDCTARELFKYAQDDPATHGKKPEELAAMLAEDDGLVSDLLALKDKGGRAAESSGGEESYMDAMRRVQAEPKKKKAKPDAGNGFEMDEDEDEDD